MGRGKPTILAKGRIAVQRIAVARQGIEQSLVGPGIAFLHQVGRAFGNGMQRRAAFRRAAKAAIAAREDGRDDGEQLVAARRLARHPFLHQHRAFAFALVQDGQHAFVGHHFAFGRQRLVEGDAALAIHHQARN